jgi:Skp family chaperone for outer membrane proteins
MNSIRSGWSRSPLLAAAVLGVAILSASALQVGAGPAPAPAPAVVATIDIERLMNNLQESKDRNDLVQSRGADLQRRLNEAADQIKAKREDLESGAIPKSDYNRRNEVIREIFEADALRRARLETYQSQHDIERGDVVHEIFDKVLAAATDLAKKEGYDLVLMDDRAISFPPLGSGTFNQVSPILSSKRVIYAAPEMDITDRLITIMNNQYNAGKGATPPPAPAPAPTAPTTPPASPR